LVEQFHRSVDSTSSDIALEQTGFRCPLLFGRYDGRYAKEKTLDLDLRKFVGP